MWFWGSLQMWGQFSVWGVCDSNVGGGHPDLGGELWFCEGGALF